MKLLIAAAFVIVAASSAHAQTVRVFTPHDASGLTDKPTKDRMAAVEDMKKRLVKVKGVALVDADAALGLEVTSVGWEDAGKAIATAAPLGNGIVGVSPSTTLQELRGHVRLTSGTFSTEFDAGVGPFGRSVGENLARKVEDWLKENAAALQGTK